MYFWRKKMFYLFNEVRNDSNLKSLVGKKAISLIEMAGWDLPVPDGGCIVTDTFSKFISENKLDKYVEGVVNNTNQDEIIENSKILQQKIMEGKLPEELSSKIEKFLNSHPDKFFAVRSSGTKEDLGALSFAGQYTSILNVKNKEDVFNAIKECWSSLYNDRLITYCLFNKIDLKSMKLAVVVQEMIPSEKSGVVFTINPLNGSDKEMIIEATYGLGEALVGGEVTPDQYYYNWYERSETDRKIGEKKISIIPINEAPFTQKVKNSDEIKKQAALTDKEIKELAELALRVQMAYGFPVDIEWAKFGDKFYIVQSRPITMINYSGIEGEWTTADFKDGGVSSTVCTPYMWALYDLTLENSMPEYMQEIGFINEKNEVDNVLFGDMHFGRPYWNAQIVKDYLKKMPGFVERDYEEDIGIEVTYEGTGYVSKLTAKTLKKGLKVLNKLNNATKLQMKNSPGFKEKQSKKLNELEKFNPKSLSRAEFFGFFEKFIKEDYYYSESSYFKFIYNNSNLQSVFKKYMLRVKKDVDLLQLMSGLHDISHLLPNYDLWDISRIIKRDKKACEFWKGATVAELNEYWTNNYNKNHMGDVRRFVKEYKYHSTRELDITIPRYGEDPSFVFKSLKEYIKLDDSHNPKTLSTHQFDAYMNYENQLLNSIPIYKKRRVKKKIHEMRNFLWWREEYRDLSTRYYYEVRRFTLVLAKHFLEMNVINERDDVFFLNFENIFEITKGNMTGEQVKDLIQRNKDYYKSFRNFQNPNEIGSRFHSQSHEVDTNAHSLKGIPASPGTVTGKCKVILDIFDSDRLEEGDILITKFTDPGWTPKFGIISAVATETGGLLSHAAVISREYGIPSVLAVKDLTKIVKDGQTVTINGDRGEVIIHED